MTATDEDADVEPLKPTTQPYFHAIRAIRLSRQRGAWRDAMAVIHAGQARGLILGKIT